MNVIPYGETGWEERDDVFGRTDGDDVVTPESRVAVGVIIHLSNCREW